MGGEGEYAMCCESLNLLTKQPFTRIRVQESGPSTDGRGANRFVRGWFASNSDMVCGELTAAAGCGEYVPAFSAFSPHHRRRVRRPATSKQER